MTTRRENHPSTVKLFIQQQPQGTGIAFAKGATRDMVSMFIQGPFRTSNQVSTCNPQWATHLLLFKP